MIQKHYCFRFFFYPSIFFLVFFFFFLFIFFFFGAFHDLIKKILPQGILTSYKLLLPLIFVFIVLVFFLLLKSKRKFDLAIRYCSYLLIILTLLETGSFATKYFS